MIDIENMTLAEIREVLPKLKELLTMFGGDAPQSEEGPYVVGTKVLIRTVTFYYLGEVKAVYPHELVLDSTTWVADTGLFGAAIAKGELGETEYMGNDVVVGRGAVVDCVLWRHDLPAK